MAAASQPAATPPSAPFEIGATVLCKSLDESWRPCEVMERKVDGKGTLFYVHFASLNRRLDRWVRDSDLRHFESDAERRKLLAELPVPLSPSQGDLRRRTRSEKRRMSVPASYEPEGGLQAADPALAQLEKEHSERTKVRNVEKVLLGRYEVDSWYYSPYPPEFTESKTLFVCEFCLKYMKERRTLERHMRECTPLHPPGNEVYRGEKVSVFEVDGALSVVYCQCLCLLAKLFLEHKTLYFDVQLFNFYVLCEHDSEGYHIAGFFSKEKNSPIDIDYNVACILTFPQFQKRGYGRFLIELSYELSRREGRPGTPERPLSDLGWISYRSFWIEALLGVLKRNGSHVSIKQISELTGIKSDDVISTLQDLGLVRYMRGEYVVVATPKLVEQCMATFTKKPGAGDRVQFDPTLLAWDARLAQQRPRYGAKRRRLSAPAVAAAEPSTQP